MAAHRLRSGALHGRRRSRPPGLPLPGAGLQPLAEIVDQAGPRVGGSALGARLGVTFGSWVTIDPPAVRSALPGFVTVATKRRPPAAGAARRRVDGAPAADAALQRQVRYLRLVLKDGSADELNLVGFVNYILGSTDVSTSLQAAGRHGDRRGSEQRRRGRPGHRFAAGRRLTGAAAIKRWLPSPGALLALRQSFAFDAASPLYGVSRRRATGRAHRESC